MEKALRIISVESGHDPRDFSLISFGGAGGLHAADLTRALGLQRAIIPANPGAFSALGVLVSDVSRETSQAVLLSVSSDRLGKKHSQAKSFLADLNQRFERMVDAAGEDLRRDGFETAAARIERFADIRYRGQSYQIPIAFRPGFAKAFHSEHNKLYGYSDTSRPLEIVTLKVRITLPVPKPRLHRQYREDGEKHLPAALVARRSAWIGRAKRLIPFYDRTRLLPGSVIRGPAIVVEYSSTTVLPEDFLCRVDEFCNLILTRAGPATKRNWHAH